MRSRAHIRLNIDQRRWKTAASSCLDSDDVCRKTPFSPSRCSHAIHRLCQENCERLSPSRHPSDPTQIEMEGVLHFRACDGGILRWVAVNYDSPATTNQTFHDSGSSFKRSEVEWRLHPSSSLNTSLAANLFRHGKPRMDLARV